MTFKVGDNVVNKTSGYVGISLDGVTHFAVNGMTFRKEDFSLVEKMKYKVGDKVRVVANSSYHGFCNGDIVVIDKEDGGNYHAYLFQNPSEAWFVLQYDIEPFIALPEQQTKSPMEVVDKYYEDLVKDIMKPEVVEDDPVESPSHYSSDKIECVDYLKDNMPFEAYIGGLEWNVKKYLHRWRRKGKPVEDLKKARWYLDRLINELVD